MPLRKTENRLSAIALLFHAIGLVLAGSGKTALFRQSTPLHLLLMALLMLIAYRRQLTGYAGWLLLAAALSFAAEWTGVHTGLLFGSYAYGKGLGLRWLDIPLLIGVNWALVVSGAYSIAAGPKLPAWCRPLLAGLLAAGYDFLLEPVAVRLDWWHWQGAIPFYNYLCWAGLAALLAVMLQRLRIRPNQFAVNLFLLQLLFFLLLRLLL